MYLRKTCLYKHIIIPALFSRKIPSWTIYLLEEIIDISYSSIDNSSAEASRFLLFWQFTRSRLFLWVGTLLVIPPMRGWRLPKTTARKIATFLKVRISINVLHSCHHAIDKTNCIRFSHRLLFSYTHEGRRCIPWMWTQKQISALCLWHLAACKHFYIWTKFNYSCVTSCG